MLSSKDNMSNLSIICQDDIHMNDDRVQEAPSSINAGTFLSIYEARGSAGVGEATKNKYMTFFSCVDEKPDMDIKHNEVVVPENKQDDFRPKDFLHYLSFLQLLLTSYLVWHLILSVISMKRITLDIKPSISLLMKPLSTTLPRWKKPVSGSYLYGAILHNMNASQQAFMWNNVKCNHFCILTHVSLNICLW